MPRKVPEDATIVELISHPLPYCRAVAKFQSDDRMAKSV